MMSAPASIDPKVEKLVDLLGYEEDRTTWNDIFSSIFNGVAYTELFRVRDTVRDRVNALYDERKQEGVRVFSDQNDLADRFSEYFSVSSQDLVLCANEPVMIECGFAFDTIVPGIGITFGSVPIYLGEGAKIQDSRVTSPLYMCDDSLLMRSKVASNTNAKTYSFFTLEERAISDWVYIGKGTIVEEADQVQKSVLGSSIPDPVSGYGALYFHGNAINNGIIGGSSAVSDGVDWQNHITGPNQTRLIDIQDDKLGGKSQSKYVIHGIGGKKGRYIPTFIGVDVSIGDGIQIVSPLIIERGSVVRSIEGLGRARSGLIKDRVYHDSRTGKCYDAF